jgi:hypothetical protein
LEEIFARAGCVSSGVFQFQPLAFRLTIRYFFLHPLPPSDMKQRRYK